MDIAVQLPWLRRSFFASNFSPWIFDRHFRAHISNSELYAPFPSFYYPQPSLPCLPSWVDSGHSEMRMEKDRYTINLDVKNFSPEELSVQISGGFIEIHGKHKDRQDSHGLVSQEFLRRYKVPVGLDPGTVTSSLCAESVLTITAPHKQPDIPERIVPITRDEKPALTAPQK